MIDKSVASLDDDQADEDLLSETHLPPEETHRRLAAERSRETVELLEKPDRTHEEDERMVYAAHASLQHWRLAGTGLHQQRGEWLLSRVYAELGNAAAALRHAERCLALTEKHAETVQDYDRAYAYEAVARASAAAGLAREGKRYHRLADEAGRQIADDEVRDRFARDLRGGAWHGLM